MLVSARSEERINRTTAGVRSLQTMLADNCRKFDIRVLNASILNSEYQYLSINRRFMLATSCQVVMRICAELRNLAIWSIKHVLNGPKENQLEKEKLISLAVLMVAGCTYNGVQMLCEFSASLRNWICSHF